MKVVKVVLLAGITGTLTSMSVFAVPLDMTFTGGAVTHSYGPFGPPPNQITYFDDSAAYTSESPGSTINLNGVTSINVTWNAPAGYMYVVNPPPSDIGGLNLYLAVQYSGPLSSLGSVTSPSLSVATVFGTSPFTTATTPLGQPVILYGPGNLMTISAEGIVNPGDKPFAFTSVTVSANFSGTGADVTLDQDLDNFPQFAALSGTFGQVGEQMPPDPGQLLTLEPLPSGSAPDGCPTAALAGLGFAGLSLFGRKLSPVAS